MAYTKNEDPWAADDLLTTGKMDHFETIYTEISGYLSSHVHDALYQTRSEMEAAFWYAGNDGSGSGADADLLYKSTGNLHAASFAGLGVATGLVILWYGSTASIPAGWALCDGTGSTIDLRGKIPVGAGTGSVYSVGDTGGSATFTATGTITVSGHAITEAEMGSHKHPYTDKSPISGSYPNVSSSGSTVLQYETISDWTSGSAGSGTAHGHSSAEGTHFDGNAVSCLPFCVALCYIQKI